MSSTNQQKAVVLVLGFVFLLTAAGDAKFHKILFEKYIHFSEVYQFTSVFSCHIKVQVFRHLTILTFYSGTHLLLPFHFTKFLVILETSM